jgi:PPK2 family polyphosphate:nucleotide phosphotransferase
MIIKDFPAPGSNYSTSDLRQILRARPSTTIAELDPDATPGLPTEEDARKLTMAMGPELSAYQERLYAESKTESCQDRRVLVVLQGLDTSGKSGIVRHVFGLVDPQGVKIKAFKKPTKEELSHDFLWRINKAVPEPGYIGIFDRSQYEDVLVVRVDELVPPEVWKQRFELINEFEKGLSDQGVTIIKCFLHISPQEQEARLLARLADPSKHWKYSRDDVTVRSKWYDYMAAYEDVLNLCNTDVAPWYVIPSNKKWYRNWAVASLLLDHLEEMSPQWPPADFDVAEQIEAVKNSLSYSANG